MILSSLAVVYMCWPAKYSCCQMTIPNLGPSIPHGDIHYPAGKVGASALRFPFTRIGGLRREQLDRSGRTSYKIDHMHYSIQHRTLSVRRESPPSTLISSGTRFLRRRAEAQLFPGKFEERRCSASVRVPWPICHLCPSNFSDSDFQFFTLHPTCSSYLALLPSFFPFPLISLTP